MLDRKTYTARSHVDHAFKELFKITHIFAFKIFELAVRVNWIRTALFIVVETNVLRQSSNDSSDFSNRCTVLVFSF